MTEELEGEGAELDELTRRRLFVKGGLAAAGLAALGSPAAATAAAQRRDVARRVTIGMVTHGDGGSFWSVAKRGAVQAGRDIGVTVRYSESNNNPQRQAQLIGTAVSQKVDGIAVSAPNAGALKDALKRASSAGIPIITLNSGVNESKSLGAYTHVGQTETIAGNGAGARFKQAGAKRLLVVIHEQANIGLEQRFSGAKAGFGGATQRLQVAGTGDVSTTRNQIQAKLSADRQIDAVLTLNPDIALAAQDAIAGARSRARLATFDLSGNVITAIQRGRILFAVDQQQYLQGYLPIVFLYLTELNLNTIGGGQPVLTGPGFVDKSNAARVAALAKAGTR
jgi:simple sugar transport system substrate-binding protein